MYFYFCSSNTTFFKILLPETYRGDSGPLLSGARIINFDVVKEEKAVSVNSRFC
jgi:hypothetical protein